MKIASKIALFAFAAGLAACSDSSVAPKSQAPTAAAAITGGSTAALTSFDTLRFSFVIDPSRQTFYYLGAGNSIVFPKGSLCDPYKSTYGIGQWDRPCPLATQPLIENAKAWIDKYGHPRIDFSPSIRFVPSNDPTQWVVMSFTDFSASWNPMSSINYCVSASAANCIDESKSDPSLATVKDPVTGQLTRRLKHFSGYNVFSGSGCDDPTQCTDDGSGGSMSRGVVGVPGLPGRNP